MTAELKHEYQRRMQREQVGQQRPVEPANSGGFFVLGAAFRSRLRSGKGWSCISTPTTLRIFSQSWRPEVQRDHFKRNKCKNSAPQGGRGPLFLLAFVAGGFGFDAVLGQLFEAFGVGGGVEFFGLGLVGHGWR